jgi:hypothetical protein
MLPLDWQEGKLMLQGHRDMRHEAKSTGISKDHYEEKEG